MRRFFAFLLASSLLACAGETREVTVSLLRPQSSACRPDEIRQIVLDPLGYTPRERRPVVRLDLMAPDGRVALTSFGPEVIAVGVQVEGVVDVFGVAEPWIGGGFAALTAEDSSVVPVLPLRQSCTLADMRDGRAPPGAAVVGLPDGRLLIAGGEREAVLLRLVVVEPGAEVARTLDVDARPRVRGTATPLTFDRVLLAGGAAAAGGAAREVFEVVRLADGLVVHGGILRGARRDHGAALLPDGRVLLVGGTDETGAVRDDAEVIEVREDGASTSSAGALGVARTGAPSVLVLDDGAVVVVGGTDEAGAPVGLVERFDLATGTFETLATLPASSASVYASLTGARVGRVSPSAIDVLVDGGARAYGVEVPWEGALEDPHVVGLADGRMLVVGRRPGESAPSHFVVDPGGSRTLQESSLEPILGTRAPAHLVGLAEGLVAEVNADGVSLLRLGLTHPLGDPAATINPGQGNQTREVSLDAAGRWAAVDGRLVSMAMEARLDVPTARFLDFALTITLMGDSQILLTREGAPPLIVEVGVELRFADCSVAVLERDGEREVSIERSGRLLRLRSDGNTACELDEAIGPVGIAFVADSGSGIRAISISR